MTDLLAQLRALDEGVIIALLVVVIAVGAAMVTRNGWLGPAVIVIAFLLPITQGSMIHTTGSIWFTARTRGREIPAAIATAWHAVFDHEASALAGPAGGCDIEAILETIRTKESGGRYDATRWDGKSTASGAYQIIDSTWGDWGGYGRAVDAPPDVQDAKAGAMVVEILRTRGGDPGAVPVAWYWPRALNDPTQLDMIPAADAENTETVRQYQTDWLAIHEPLAARCAWSLPVAAPLSELTGPHHDYPSVDIAVSVGTPVTAVHAGRVDRVTDEPRTCWPDGAGCTSICGIGLTIEDAAGARWSYCHLSTRTVSLGDEISAGDELGLSGNTGHSSGPHLHLGLKVDGVNRCPQTLLQAIHDGTAVPSPDQLPTSGCTT